MIRYRYSGHSRFIPLASQQAIKSPAPYTRQAARRPEMRRTGKRPYMQGGRENLASCHIRSIHHSIQTTATPDHQQTENALEVSRSNVTISSHPSTHASPSRNSQATPVPCKAPSTKHPSSRHVPPYRNAEIIS